MVPAALALKMAQELGVVVGGDRPSRSTTRRGAGAPALDEAHGQIDGQREDRRDQHEPEHAPRVGRSWLPPTLGGVRKFAVYTVLRFLLFAGAMVLVAGVWKLVAGQHGVPLLWVVVIAAVLSAVASPFLLARQRDAVALQVQERAHRAGEAFEARRAAEDTED